MKRRWLLAILLSTVAALVAAVAARAQNLDVKGTTTGEGNAYFFQSVGVGTTAPAEKLDIAGNLRANGAIYTVAPGGYGQTYLYQWGLDSGGDMYLEPAAGRSLYLTDSWNRSGTLDIEFGNVVVSTNSPSVTTSGTNHYRKVGFYSYGLPISSGVTDSGYRVGLDVENFCTDPTFTGTLNQQIALWARAGSSAPSGAGIITNSYAIYLDNIEGPAKVTNKYGLFQANGTAKNYFAGNVGIGTEPSSSVKLDVAGYTVLGNGIADNWFPYVDGNSYVSGTNIYFRGSAANGYPTYATMSATTPLYLAGGAYSDGYGWYSASSREYKQDIRPLEDPLAILEKVNVYRYRFRPTHAKDQRERIGVIAEELPDEVAATDRKGAPTGELVALSLAADRELLQQLKAQQRRIDAQQKQIDELEALLRARVGAAAKDWKEAR